MARSLVPYIFDASFPTAHSFADPFLQLHREMNRVFDDALRGLGTPGAVGGAALGGPRMNVSETDDAIHVEAELPGVAEQDVHVELNDDMLTIRGEKKATREDKNMHVVERSFGGFSRSVRLPFPVSPDQVQASFEHGVLTVTLPKAATQQKVHRIQVQSGAGHKMVEGMSKTAEPGTTSTSGQGGDGGTQQNIAEGMSQAGGKPASGGGAARGQMEKAGKPPSDGNASGASSGSATH